tara:strand:- start:1985 stop:2566 length:582 start_codon:yes stop_codon:yes gene_type:complete
MWALIENNEISKVLTRPKAITIGDVSYPQNIFMLWSSEELESIGIYEVVVDNSNLKNGEYYINTDQSFDWNGTEVVASYGEATPKELDDTTDPETGHITHGLKWNHKEVIKSQAYGLLQPNDWYVVRHQEAGTDIPEAWATFRSEVRATAADMQSKINVCTTVDELAALYQYNDAEPPARPLGEWPQSPDNSV